MKRIDHIIVRVDDLHDGVAEFRDAGFEVYYGRKPEKAANALIYLQDNSFIELLDTKVIPPFARTLSRLGVLRRMSPFFDRLANYYFKEGPWLDYPIYSSDIHKTYARVKDRSSGILSNAKRKKPNGTVVSWTLFGPLDLNLPFVMSDYAPEKMSADETNIHPNSITGLHSVEVAFAGDLETFKGQLMDFYQIEQSNVRVNGNCFSVQTENATINYTQADRYGITAVVVKPSNPMLDAKLSEKYALSTANDE
jgi:hypothetical protein